MTEKLPSKMTDSEFAEATGRRAGRGSLPPKPTLPTAETKRDEVRAMTEDQFRDAMRRRAWRDQ